MPVAAKAQRFGGIKGLPTTMLYDREGILRIKIIGFEHTTAVERRQDQSRDLQRDSSKLDDDSERHKWTQVASSIEVANNCVAPTWTGADTRSQDLPGLAKWGYVTKHVTNSRGRNRITWWVQNWARSRLREVTRPDNTRASYCAL